MANVSLKKDFKDGDKLFAQQLNLNFEAIQAALATMNKIVWQDGDYDSVVTFRGDTEELAKRKIINGQLLYDVQTGETYIDYNGERISTGSGNAIHIGKAAPTNPSTQIWINPSDSLNSLASEITNDINSTATDKALSVNALKTELNKKDEEINKKLDASKISMGTANPSGGSNGDIYFKYSA